MRAKLLVYAAVAVFLAGCTSMKAEDFADREPRLLIEDYFAGKTQAWGIFQDRFGTLRRQFEVDIEGTWDGETLTLVEDFLYDDGETEQRIWRIKKSGAHTYAGLAEGVIDQAEGVAYGNALNWRYRFALKVGDSTWNVQFDDWLFLQDDRVLINRAVVTKLGLLIGEVTLMFQKPTQAEVQADVRSPASAAAAAH